MSFAQLLFYASLTSTIVFFLFIVFSKDKLFASLLNKEALKKGFLLGLLNPFFYYLILFKAYSLLPAQEAQPLNYTWPITISVFSVLFLKQKLNLKIILGLLSAFIGIIIIATQGDLASLKFQNAFGVSLALGSSLVWASFWVLNLLDQRVIVIKLFGAFFFGAIYSAIYLFFFDSFLIEDFSYLLGAAYVGVFEMGITFLLWNKGLELSTNKVKTSTLAYLSPFISLLFIALMLEETIQLASILGLIFIVGGILYQNLSKKVTL